MKIHVHYRLAYSYERPVSLSRQEFRIIPRQQQHLQIDRFEWSCKPAERTFYRKDLFNNEFACAFFAQPVDNVMVEMRVIVATFEHNPFDFLIDQRGETIPIQLTAEEGEILHPYRKASALSLPKELLLPKGAETVTALTNLCRWHFENIRYERREEGPARSAEETLALKSGACRDTALLLAEVLRANGFPARLVSGFLATSLDSPATSRADNALHAWVEVYVPGAGWIGCDPTNGVLCDHHYIATAIGISPEHITPINGSYFSSEKTPAKMEAMVEVTVNP